jgi:hypothetical protein
MFNPENLVAGTLVVQGVPENACFTTFIDLIKALPTYLGVQIPASVTNVIVGNVQPSSSQTTNVWFRLSNAGSFMGIYVFSQGAWHNIYPINDGNQFQIQQFVSLDGTVPIGWTKIKTGNALLPAALVADIVADDYTNGLIVQKFSAYFSGF